jgi:hypothetical protein
MLEGHSVNTSVPASAVVGCILGEILLTLLIVFVLLRRIGALPPLALLQGNGGKKRTRGGKTAAASAQPQIQKTIPVTAIPVVTVPAVGRPDVRVPARSSHSVRFVMRYIWRHSRRVAGKSALALTVAALLFAAVGQFALMKQSYTDLCENTVVKANFVGGVQLAAVPQLMGTGYVADPYYAAETLVGVNLINARAVVTNDITRYTGEDAEITYAEGYDASCMDKPGDVIIIGEAMEQIYGLTPGDTVEIVTPSVILEKVRMFVTRYRTYYPEETESLSDSEILTQQRSGIILYAGAQLREFTIAGVVSTPSGAYDTAVFAPGTDSTIGGLNNATNLDVAEFTLADYRYAKEMRDYSEDIADASLLRVDFIMDTGKLWNLVNTSNILNALYPVAVSAALLIGGFLCALVISQSSKEAAIMRVQGTTKRKTRAMLALEQILLSVIGLLVGACGLLIYNGSGITVAAGGVALFAGLYFALVTAAAVVSSVVATRKNVLELLQTKE